MALELFLREDLLRSHRDFEDPAGGWHQTKPRDLFALGPQDFFRHTDGMGKVPSPVAVFNFHVELCGH